MTYPDYLADQDLLNVSPETEEPEKREVQPTRHVDRTRPGTSSVTTVLIAVIAAVALLCAVIALAGDPDAAASTASVAILLGFIAACVFHKRWR